MGTGSTELKLPGIGILPDSYGDRFRPDFRITQYQPLRQAELASNAIDPTPIKNERQPDKKSIKFVKVDELKNQTIKN